MDAETLKEGKALLAIENGEQPLHAPSILRAWLWTHRAELIADAERINALQECKHDITICPPGQHGGDLDNWLVEIEYKERDSFGPFCNSGEGATLREAITQAIGDKND